MHRSYNGFGAMERSAAALRIRQARAEERMSASACSVCRRDLPSFHDWHLEDYRDISLAYPICRRCQHAVHIRFHLPLFWQRFMAGLPAGSWVRSLAVDPATRAIAFDQTYPSGVARPDDAFARPGPP